MTLRPQPSLHRVLDDLGATLLELVCAPSASSAGSDEIGGVAIHDPVDEPVLPRRALVLGRSALVGRPVTALLMRADATVTVAHSRTRDLAAECRRAELIVAAVGRPEMVRGDWVAPGAVVIDVGINRLPDGRLVGDCAYAECAAVAGAITPVPGGVGPMTIACLLQNTLTAARWRRLSL